MAENTQKSHLDVAAAPHPRREGDEEEEEVRARRHRHADARLSVMRACRSGGAK